MTHTIIEICKAAALTTPRNGQVFIADVFDAMGLPARCMLSFKEELLAAYMANDIVLAKCDMPQVIPVDVVERSSIEIPCGWTAVAIVL